MSVFYYKEFGKNMVIQATLQTKLACTALTIIIINVCFLIAVIAFMSKEEMCRITVNTGKTSDTKLQLRRNGDERLETSIHENPWMLAFIIFPERLLVGAASIIAKNWALTTSYCVEKVSTYPISKKAFRGGSSFWNKNGFYHFIIKLVPHEKFDSETLDYNIALAQVSRPFIYANEAPISISRNHLEIMDGNPATVIGWPVLKNNDSGHWLLKNGVELITEKACTDVLMKMRHKDIAPRSLCAYASADDKVSCIFASGGALIVNKSIIGLTSWAVTCAKNQWPGIFVNVEKSFDWLQEIKIKEEIPIEI